MWPNGSLRRKSTLTVIMLLMTVLLFAQEAALERMIRLPLSSSKASRVLSEVSRTTGYIFTYDTQILNPDHNVRLPSGDIPLRELLDSVTGDKSIKYSVIGKHIVLYRDIAVTPVDSVSDQSPPPLTINGLVVDAETSDPLEFATIGIIHKGKGTITNSNGYFILRVNDDCLDDTITFSYVGYLNRMLTVRSLAGNFMTIGMNRDFISIPEIIIRAQDPQLIIRKAVSLRGANYGTTPSMLTAFYREGVFRKKEPQVYSEAVLKIYKSPYARTVLNDQVKVIKSRKLENLEAKDTLAVRLKAGLSSSLALDGMKQLFDFMDPASMNQYQYHLTDIVTIDDETAYVISFEQKPWVGEPLPMGEVYINAENFGVMLAEFDINTAFIDKTGENLVARVPKHYTMKPETIRYRTRYRYIDGRYYLSHVRGDLVFSARGKKRLFNSRFSVFFELAITDHFNGDIERFEHDEIAPVYSIFSNTIREYDNEFWKDFDFLKPEDDLLESLSGIRIRLGEFGN